MEKKFDYLLSEKEITKNYSSYSDIKRNLFDLKLRVNSAKEKINSCFYLNKSREEEQKALKPFLKIFNKNLKKVFSEQDVLLLAEKLSQIPEITRMAILNITSMLDDEKNHYAIINSLCDLYNANILRHDFLTSVAYLKKSGNKVHVWQKMSKDDKGLRLQFINDFLIFHKDDTEFIKNLNQAMIKDIDILFKEIKFFNVYVTTNQKKVLERRKEKNYLNTLQEIKYRFGNQK